MKQLNFYYILRKSKPRSDGSTPIFARLTYGSKRITFSTGISVKASNWNKQKQQVRGNHPNNIILTNLKLKYENYFITAYLNDDYDLKSIRDKIENSYSEYSLLDGISDYLLYVKSLINIEYKESTYKKQQFLYNQIEEYLKYSKKGVSYLLVDVDLNFLQELEYYFKTVIGNQLSTVHKAMSRFRTVIRYLYKQGKIETNPYERYTMPKFKKEIIYLTTDELTRLEALKCNDERLENVRKLLVFVCYTGLGYAELKSFRRVDLQIEDNIEFINVKRQKTELNYIVPLLPKAREVLKHFDYELPVLSNQKMNKNLKSVLEELKIEKRITMHSLRKTFASTVLLGNGVPMDIVSKLLGHSNTKTTEQSYAVMSREAIFNAIEKLLV